MNVKMFSQTILIFMPIPCMRINDQISISYEHQNTKYADWCKYELTYDIQKYSRVCKGWKFSENFKNLTIFLKILRFF